MTDYSDIILKAYESMDKTPWGNQKEIINDILNEFIDNDKKYVALNASTGLGKSIISVVTSMALKEIIGETQKSSFILMHNNTLLQQYKNDFEHKTSCITLLGASNYTCSVLNDSADNCVQIQLLKANDQRVEMCESCKYKESRKKAHIVEQIFTNYSYFFTAALYTQFLKPRLLTVYDEGQLVNDIFINHMKIGVSIKGMEKNIKEFGSGDELKHCKSSLKSIINDLKGKRITEINATEIYLNKLIKVYEEASKYFENEADIAGLHSPERFKKLNKISNKFKQSMSRIIDFFEHKYEHVIEIKDDEFSIQPIFMNDMFKKTHLSEYHLFMSATIDPYFISKTMNIEEREIAFIKPKAPFAKENKKVNFLNLDKYNYANMQKPETISKMIDFIKKIVVKHKDESGLILTPSFVLSKRITDSLRKYLKLNKINVRIFNQEQGEHLKDVLARFKNYKGKGVLISPSIFEGIDLAGDLSRYQIFTKAPYASLADKRIKLIANTYPQIYKIITIQKIVQGLGRSIRNKDDYATGYMLDENLYYLFNSEFNHWKDEFSVSVVRR